jgi:hypothetical protein
MIAAKMVIYSWYTVTAPFNWRCPYSERRPMVLIVLLHNSGIKA